MAKKRKNKEVEIPQPETEATTEPGVAQDDMPADGELLLEAATEVMAELEDGAETPLEAATEEESAAGDELAPFLAPESEEQHPLELAAEALENVVDEDVPDEEGISLEGTELDGFESAAIEDLEFIEGERLDSIIESIFFASDRPVSLNAIKMIFKGTQVKTDHIRRAINRLQVELAGATRGVSLEEVPGGYQLRTKLDNMKFLTRGMKARPFKLSGPALEVLAIVAYKQPVIKAEIDEIRGVESGHLLRALMERGLCGFEGKSDLPGKPMQYSTSKKFLEIFGLRNLKELPTLSQIDELMPEGIGEEFQQEKSTLDQLTDKMSRDAGVAYSEGEDELQKIADTLADISVTSEFFEAEKLKERQRREAERADRIRDAIINEQTVSNRDRNWLVRYDEALRTGTLDQFTREGAAAEAPIISPAASADGAETTEEGRFSEEEDTSIDEDMGLHMGDADIDGDADADDGPEAEA